MTDFLTFLNTASVDVLTKTPGVTRQIAENIIAARPFDFVEDCLQVRGVGKNLLARMQDTAAAEVDESESRAMVPVEEEAMPAVENIPHAQESAREKGPSFWSRLWRAFIVFLRALVRLILIIALFIAIGAGLYYGLPYINARFIAPVEQNTAQINKLESDIASLQSQLNETNQRVDTLEKSVEAHTASLAKLEEMQNTLEDELQGNNDKVLLELKHQVMLTRSLDMLGRARVYLAQSNFGLAREDVQSARDLLSELQVETQDSYLERVIARLDLALTNLPGFPVVASGDLEIAWEMLVTGQSENDVTTATPTPGIAPTDAQTPTLELTPPPTPIATEMPTLAPTPTPTP